MPITIQCKKVNKGKEGVKVKIFRAPLVDSNILRSVISARAKAIVL